MKNIIFTTIISLFITTGSLAQYSGTCGAEGDGSNLTWTLNAQGVLTISGTGAMKDYDVIYVGDNGITSSPWGKHASLLKSLVIEEGITYIGVVAFYSCNSFMGSLIIGDSVETIEGGAFSYCSGFTGYLIIPNSVVTIGNSAFSNCSNFVGSLTIPNSVVTIGAGAFEWCSGFTGSLNIPNLVKIIGYNAFSYCTGFTSIISDAVVPPTTIANTFIGVNKSIPVYVPKGTLEDYKAAEGWKEFFNIIEMEEVSIEDNTQLITGVYPNADSTFSIDVTGNETYIVTVANMQGQIVKCEMITGNSHTININNQPAGVYLFVVDNGKQKSTAKVIKN